MTPGDLRVDGHVDLPYYLMNREVETRFQEVETGPFTLEKAREAGVRLFVTALYCEDPYNGDSAAGRLREVLDFALDRLEGITMVQGLRDLASLRDDTQAVGTLFLLENADALAGNPSGAEALWHKGVRVIGLTHAGKNRLADGNAVAFSEGLTREGEDVVRAALDCGMLLDAAHLHPGCFRELMRLVEAPVISSHTGVRERCDIPRNLSLEQVAELLQRDGLVGITFNPEMITAGRPARIDDVFAHLDTVVQKFGPGGVAIGSDLCGFDRVAEGLEDVRGFSRLADVLLDHGYEKEAVAGILGGNWLRILERLYAAS